MTRRLHQRKVICCVCIFVTAAVLCYLIHVRLQSEESITIDPRKSYSSHRSAYVQLLKTIPPFLDQSGNAMEDTREILYIDAENEMEWKRRLPNALVIGIRKGGTRAVLNFLSRHPSVRVCPREVHFFDRQENYIRGSDWYREQMPLSFSSQTTIEKTPAYFVTEDVPNRVFKMSPSIKLLVVVRDPTIRAISDYAQLFEKSNGTLRSFEQYITEDPQHRILRKTSSIVTTGIYVDHLNKWLEYFPLEQIHFISGEMLVKNPVHEMQSVENFLGLKPYINENLFYYNDTKGFLCLVRTTQKGEGDQSGCLSDSKGRPHPPVNEDVVTLLRDFYRPLNKHFYRAIGRNFGWP